ncbi:MAG: Holliday junction branch migration protein RuvA [Gammaproteobacteria bacterium]|nr:Holliday junction branch migration protein RuvA [Gammaproteobacteria bacterium]
MIGFLRGTLLLKQPPLLLVDVQGVGYEVEAPMSTFYELPDTGNEITLQTHLVVRDDAHLLFGFATSGERALFRELIKVSGVGARVALTILSGASVDQFSRAVHEGDAASLTRLPGIGKKTAERLIIEMRDKLDKGSFEASIGSSGAAPQPVDEAMDALVALGYKPAEAQRMLKAVAADDLGSEELIRLALQASIRK